MPKQTPSPDPTMSEAIRIIEMVAEQLRCDAQGGREYGTRRMAVPTLDAYAENLRNAIEILNRLSARSRRDEGAG